MEEKPRKEGHKEGTRQAKKTIQKRRPQKSNQDVLKELSNLRNHLSRVRT